MYSKIKVFGHPMHPMLVAFPVAFYTGTLAAFVIYGARGDMFWLKMAIAANIVGVGMAVVAALPGWIDFFFGIPSGTPARRTGWLHQLLNVTGLAAFAVTLGVYAQYWNGPAESAKLGIILTAAGVGITILAGFQGWKLVQTHHVGVDLTPAQEEKEPYLRRAG
jgi:uncharacterized membrane protein